jgi:nitrogen-specific signal transduction histidine kinase
VFLAATDDDAVRTLSLAETDVIIRDATPPVHDLAGFVARVRELSPTAVIVGIGTDDATAGADYGLAPSFAQRDLTAVLREAEERHRLRHEVETLGTLVSPPVTGAGERATSLDMSAAMLEQTLKEFAKALAAGFDLPRMLDLFLDAVGEMVRPSRSALLLPDATGRWYGIRAHRGLAPQIVDSIHLPAGAGVPQWLVTQGRVLRLDEALQRASVPRTRALARELTLLQAVVAIPLIARGELVAILTLGERIVGGAYGRREMEILFTLATQFGMAIHHSRLHHRLHREKEFSERILAHMSSGVITIGRDEKIGMMNRRAEEILQVASRDAIDHDLRVLPSPLGDMLFETLSHRVTVDHSEVHLALRNLPLEVSTYPILGEELEPLGAVLVFEDLSAQKALAAEKRQAEQFQLLTRVVARIAEEIKNPLVSVNMLMELLDEGYDDPEFRRHFSGVVRRDVGRMLRAFERMTALVHERDPKFEAVDLRAAVGELLEELGAVAVHGDAAGAARFEFTDEAFGKRVRLDLSHQPALGLATADRAQLKKALSYLIWYIVHKSPAEQATLSISAAPGDDAAQLRVLSRTATIEVEELQRLFDPITMAQESLIDLGPAVSQRILEALGGRLQVRQARHELSFLITLPVARG